MPYLNGLKVLDMTQYEAGPSCTQVLAWFGADVVKVESPTRGDASRSVGRGGGNSYSAFFCVWNMNKRSLAIDLTQQKGRELLRQLATKFDVFVENYAPGVVERFDVDYESLRSLNPSLIYACIKGYGTTGPYADFNSVDPTAQASAAAFSINGEKNKPPLMPGPTMADAGTGLQAAMAILAAWAQKLRTGQGQYIELSMQEAVTYYMRSRFYQSSMDDHRPASSSGNKRGLPPTGMYACKPHGMNDYVYIQSLTEHHWGALCRALKRPELRTDLRFYSPRWRFQNGKELTEIVSDWTGERTKFECMQILAEAGVPSSACLDTVDLHRDPHLIERGFIHELELPDHGKVQMLGFAGRSLEGSVSLQPPPLLGEHSDAVLKEELGLSDTEIETLYDKCVICDNARSQST